MNSNHLIESEVKISTNIFSNQPYHIVFVSQEYPPSLRAGGIATYVQESALSLVKNGFRVTVICASDDTRLQSNYTEYGINIIRLSGGDFFLEQIEKKSFFIKKLRFVYRFFSYRFKIKKTIESLSEVSIIEVPEYGAEGLFLFSLDLPMVVRLHCPMLLDGASNQVKRLSLRNFHHYWRGLIEFEIVKKAKYVISVSESLKSFYVNKVGINAHKIKTIYNAIDTENLWQNNPVEIPEDTIPTVLFVGSVIPIKGVAELIEAFRLLNAKGTKIKLVLAGKVNNKFAEDLQKQIKSERIDDIIFLGHLNRKELEMLYARATICCLPSWSEGLPFVCLEAMRAGCVVIGSSNGGMTEIIEEAKDGILCLPQNAAYLAHKIEEVLRLSYTERLNIGENAKKKIFQKFSSTVIAKENIDYYLSMLHSSKKK